MKTPAQVEALRLAHENAVWNAIQNNTLNPGKANPPASAIGQQVANAMIQERSMAYAFQNSPNATTEAAFDAAYNRTASLLAQWTGGGSASSSSAAGTVAGIGLPVLIVGGLAAWYFLKKRKGGGKRKKLFGIL